MAQTLKGKILPFLPGSRAQRPGMRHDLADCLRKASSGVSRYLEKKSARG